MKRKKFYSTNPEERKEFLRRKLWTSFLFKGGKSVVKFLEQSNGIGYKDVIDELVNVFEPVIVQPYQKYLRRTGIQYKARGGYLRFYIDANPVGDLNMGSGMTKINTTTRFYIYVYDNGEVYSSTSIVDRKSGCYCRTELKKSSYKKIYDSIFQVVNNRSY